MSGTPFSSGDCCLPGAEGLTYVRVGPQQHIVGMMNLESVFNQLIALGRQPNEVSNEEILGMARQSNYIAHNPEAEANYAEALRRAYGTFYGRQQDANEPTQP